MKKILSFVIVLGLLSGGVFYYSGGTLSSSDRTSKLEKEVAVQHPSWKDTIIPLEEGRIKRKGTGDTGNVQNVTTDSFEIVWDKWDIEVFKKNPKTGIYNLFDRRKKNKPDTK